MDTEEVPILRITDQDRHELKDTVAAELPLTIILNRQEIVTLRCSPTKLDYLVIGFLSSAGLIASKDDIEEITIDEERGLARVIAREDRDSDIPTGRLIASSTVDASDRSVVKSLMEVTAPQVLALMEDFIQRSRLFRTTGGVHSAALSDTRNILIFSEDIGRHNAIDKVFGECLLRDIPTDDHIIITSGRVSSEILLKVAKRNIPLLISKAAPTSLGVKLAAHSGITLIGFVRGKRMNTYSGAWRLRHA